MIKLTERQTQALWCFAREEWMDVPVHISHNSLRSLVERGLLEERCPPYLHNTQIYQLTAHEKEYRLTCAGEVAITGRPAKNI